MTYRCNHRCLFCSCPWEAENGLFKKEKELTQQAWKVCIRSLVEMGCSTFAFTGGEPLLNPDILEIIEFSANLETEHIETQEGKLRSWMAPPKLYLLTNGKLMDDDILGLCRKHDIHLSMSLPGLTTFQEHTRSEGPGHILYWFSRAHEMGLKTTVNITVTRKNLPELFENISQALIAGAGSLLMNRFLPGGRGLSYADELTLSKEQIVTALDVAESVLRKANRYGSMGTELPKCVLDIGRYKHLQVGTRCSAALDFFVIDPSGYIRVCNHSPVRLHHFSEIEKVKTHPYWTSFVKKDYLPVACLACPEIADCDGGCREAAHIVGGRPDAMDPVMSGNP